MKPRIEQLTVKLQAAWSAETANTWTAGNPAEGQCSVTALVVQDLCGGSIRKTRVGANWHFYNLIDGNRIDLTASQFAQPIAYDDLEANRDEAFGDTSLQQYEALRRRVQPFPA